ncbi:MAG TPA: J domain-containing protein [Hyphomicrobiaceae bacterium]|jgi:hypothetical protein|nr:J domain-containing protein [Hyphomicrobiaceae bacterium]
MGELIKGWSFLLATGLLVLGPAPAFCDDLLVMPYACAIVGGRVLLTPGENQSHRIIGAREQHSFRTCSAVDPRLCRQWTIHRFEMDCDGTPVSWASVVANARPDRARLENGRLHVRMPPNWSLAPDDPCAGGQRGRYGHLQRYCADRRALSPPASVEMPPGFAPLLGIDAIFVTPSPPKSAGQVAAYSSQLPAATPFSAGVARSVGEPQQAEGPKPPVREPPVQLPPPAKQPLANADLSTSAPSPAALPAPVVPRIINRPAAVAEPAPSAPATRAPPPSAPATAATETTSSPSEAPVLSLVPDPPEPAIFSLASPRTAVAVVASVLVAFSAVVLMLASGRRPRVAPNRDIARVSIGEPGRQRKLVPQQHVVRAPSAIWSTAAGARPVWNEDVPRTRADALQVLGMGVTADANLAAIKKIVDGLRQTWHPDLARDAPEREVREKRMKQINVAWDILAAKPAQT